MTKRKYHVSFDIEAESKGDYPLLIEDVTLTKANIQSMLMHDYTTKGKGYTKINNLKITSRK